VSLDKFRLDGQCALVTGGSKGLGRAMARALASAGAAVVLASRNLSEAEEAAEEIARLGHGTLGLEADTTDREAVQEMVRRAEETFGKIDILINNAGINIRRPTLEVEDADWDPVIDINVKGVLVCAQAVAPGIQHGIDHVRRLHRRAGGLCGQQARCIGTDTNAGVGVGSAWGDGELPLPGPI
jgi:NAD(P)-dependent dehydrogenase (short-subunit alcohol dehydrogenase family)